MTLTLHGRIPSKKNSKRIVMFGHRPALISSKDYQTWHTMASYELKGQLQGRANRIKESGPHAVSILLYAPNAVRGDLTNKAESIMDLLVDNGVIMDDNWRDVPEITLTFMGIDRTDPRAEIRIAKAESKYNL